MLDIELKLKQELNNPSKSKEQLMELVKQYMIYTNSYINGNESAIKTLKNSNNELKQQIKYLQGNNKQYTSNIDELKQAIIDDLSKFEQEILKDTKNTVIKYVNNIILTILNESKTKINKRFFEYLNPEYTKAKGFITYDEWFCIYRRNVQGR